MKLRIKGFDTVAYALFVASIEAIGNVIEPAKVKCDVCKEVQEVVAAYRTALRLVEDDHSGNFKRMKKAYSAFRSPALNLGQLFGDESLGHGTMMSGNSFITRQDEVFKNQELWLALTTSDSICHCLSND